MVVEPMVKSTLFASHDPYNRDRLRRQPFQRCGWSVMSRFHESGLWPNEEIEMTRRSEWHSTTILCVRHNGLCAMGGDGQVTHGTTILKADTKKIRWLLEKKVLVGFAGSTADAFALMERFEAKLKDYPNNVPRAATELARDWRTDRMLRRLEAMLIVANDEHALLITGQGDVIQPTDGVLGIGSGSGHAIAAARALIKHSKLSAADIVAESLRIAAELDIYTNDNLVVEEFSCRRTGS